jgi:hypothetical protein
VGKHEKEAGERYLHFSKARQTSAPISRDTVTQHEMGCQRSHAYSCKNKQLGVAGLIFQERCLLDDRLFRVSGCSTLTKYV